MEINFSSHEENELFTGFNFYLYAYGETYLINNSYYYIYWTASSYDNKFKLKINSSEIVVSSVKLGSFFLKIGKYEIHISDLDERYMLHDLPYQLNKLTKMINQITIGKVLEELKIIFGKKINRIEKNE